MGEHGHGTPELCDVEGRVDIITGTLGKALGGASGGYTSGRKEIVELLRQRSQALSLFELPGAAYCCGIAKGSRVLTESADLRRQLREEHRFFRRRMSEAGFNILPGSIPLCR